jgi:hypothetical protein
LVRSRRLLSTIASASRQPEGTCPACAPAHLLGAARGHVAALRLEQGLEAGVVVGVLHSGPAKAGAWCASRRQKESSAHAPGCGCIGRHAPNRCCSCAAAGCYAAEGLHPSCTNA